MTRIGALFERTPDGVWVGSCPSIPGAIAQGRTLPECRRHLRAAIGSVLMHAPTDDIEDLADSAAVAVRAELLDIQIPERPAVDLVSQSDIARIAGVSRQAVHGWTRSRRDFPRPFTRTATGPRWRRDDILHWLGSGRRAAGRPSTRASWSAAASAARQ